MEHGLLQIFDRLLPRRKAAASLGAAVFVLLGTLSVPGAFERSRRIDPETFADPPREYRQHAWLTYDLSAATEESMTLAVRRWAERDAAGGFYLGMGGGSTEGLSLEYLQGSGRKPSDRGIAFLSEEYFDLYAGIIEAGLANGIAPMVFYDEWGYPSGMAGGHLYSKYPQHAAKSLEKVERDITGPARVVLDIPEGIAMGAARMNLDTKETVDIGDAVEGRRLECSVPRGRWKVMAFYLDPKASLGQGVKSGYVDYLDAEAVRAYIDLNYQAHYDHLRKYWGDVLQITHYDEPAMHVSNGKAWTPGFNAGFEREHGYSPVKHYPALWYDIGPETAAARNALFGFRARLFSECFIKQMDDWCRAHGIMLSGHLDQEEIDNPVPVNGDLMLAFKHQQVPAIDDIWWWGRTNRAYKLVGSAGYNWDKPFFMAETYAGYRDVMSPEIVWKVAIDQAAMGVNFQVGALPREKTPESDRFIGRNCYMLQHGRHVADAAILYPIASLQAAYRFGDWGGAPRGAESAYAREGGIVPPETDYIELGELLFRGLRQDFTFLHPQALEERCAIEGDRLILDNAVNREEYSVLIIPGSRVLSVETARKIRAFYDSGGAVIATGVLAVQSAEMGQDAAVARIMGEMFGLPEDGPMTARFERRIDEFMVYFVNRNDAGGRAYFLPDYTPEMIRTVMGEVVPVRDVAIAEPMWRLKIGRGYDGSLTYIHKVKDGRNLYYFGNSSDRAVETEVTLRGAMDLSIWDPMSGRIRPVEEGHSRSEDGRELTAVPLVLPPVTALFYVEEPYSASLRNSH
ncbi:MAG: hypothetical protein JW793_05295 [Acidobacteria bacterium]|nr:hypothetical protein [Acidobacteriota bacterium]